MPCIDKKNLTAARKGWNLIISDYQIRRGAIWTRSWTVFAEMKRIGWFLCWYGTSARRG